MNPIVNGIRYCGVVHSVKDVVFYASIRLERRHTYGKHTAYGVRTRWKTLTFRELGKFPTRAEAKAAVKTFLDLKREEMKKNQPTTLATPVEKQLLGLALMGQNKPLP